MIWSWVPVFTASDFTNSFTTGTLVVVVALVGIAIQIRRYQRSVQADNFRALEKKCDRLEGDIREREARITQLSAELRAEQAKPNIDGLSGVMADQARLIKEGFTQIRQQGIQVAERLAQSEERSADLHLKMLGELEKIATHREEEK